MHNEVDIRCNVTCNLEQTHTLLPKVPSLFSQIPSASYYHYHLSFDQFFLALWTALLSKCLLLQVSYSVPFWFWFLGLLVVYLLQFFQHSWHLHVPRKICSNISYHCSEIKLKIKVCDTKFFVKLDHQQHVYLLLSMAMAPPGQAVQETFYSVTS